MLTDAKHAKMDGLSSSPSRTATAPSPTSSRRSSFTAPSPRVAKSLARPWPILIPSLEEDERRRHESVLGVLSEAALSASLLQSGLSPSAVRSRFAVPVSANKSPLPRVLPPVASPAERFSIVLDKIAGELSPARIAGRLSPLRSPTRKARGSPQITEPSDSQVGPASPLKKGDGGAGGWAKPRSLLARTSVVKALASPLNPLLEPSFPSKRAALPDLLAKLEASFPTFQEARSSQLSGGSGVAAVRRIVTNNFVQVSRLLKQHDTDKSGELDKAELVGLVTALGAVTANVDTKDIETFFDEFDHDRSGSISVREFKRSLRSNPTSHPAKAVPR